MKRFEIAVEKDRLLHSPAGRPFAFDLYYPLEAPSCPLILFAHGFKGFKDWGHWGLIAEAFARRGFAFLKFNFSHNGVTPGEPLDFADLEAFGQNNFTKELQDLSALTDALFERPPWLPPVCDLERLCLIGHSRGGATAILFAAREPRIKALSTWASVSDAGFLWKDAPWIGSWRENGVIHIPNARTMQDMPLYYQLYEDFVRHGDQYRLETQFPRLQIPLLIAHGDADPGVPVSNAYLLKEWNPRATLEIIEGADHVFGGAHPYPGTGLPTDSALLVEKTAAWLE
jgi:uncharacterized protein